MGVRIECWPPAISIGAWSVELILFCCASIVQCGLHIMRNIFTHREQKTLFIVTKKSENRSVLAFNLDHEQYYVANIAASLNATTVLHFISKCC